MTFLSGWCSIFNSALSGVQNLTHGSAIRDTELVAPPIFIVGHWRSGTTLMHELMSLDPQLAYPTNYDAFVPGHCIVSRWMFKPIMNLLLPSKRPMDNMALGADSPQEDDFALLSLNAPTPYRKIAFPFGTSQEERKLDPDNLSPAEINEIKDCLTYFYKVLTVQYGKRLVLKSPPHTGRLKLLAECFPGAKFVHMSRHPYKLVPSTNRLWNLLYQLQAFQVGKIDDQQMTDYIFKCKDLLYGAYFRDRAEIPEEQLIEVRFEDLVANPISELERVYGQLNLEGLDGIIPKAADYMQQKSGHKTIPHAVDHVLNARIDQHWREYMETFSYSPEDKKR